MSKAGLWNGAEPWNCTWGTGIRFREITEFFGFRSISFHENHENLHDSHWKFYEFPCVKLLGFIYFLEEQLFHGFSPSGHSKSLGRVNPSWEVP